MSQFAFADDQASLLRRAQDGDMAALGLLFEQLRSYLLVIADGELDRTLRTKVGASDIVQETFLEAQRDLRWFSGNGADDLQRWLVRILRNNSRDAARRFRGAKKRDASREVSLDEQTDAKSEHLRSSKTPSRVAAAKERLAAVLDAIEELPADQRKAIVMRGREQRSFAEIGQIMGRSPEAARKLWVRGMRGVEAKLASADEKHLQ